MKKTFLLACVFIIFISSGFSQNAEIKSIINESAELVVPKNFKYFNLVDTSFPTEFNEILMSPNEAQELKINFPDFPYEEFLSLAKSDTSFLDWNNFEIKNAKIHPYQNIPQFHHLIRNYQLVPYDISGDDLKELNQNKQPDVMIVRVKKNWDEQRVEKECQHAYSKNSKKIKKEEASYFWFSKPLISKNGFALVTLNESGKGATYIFKKTEGIWKKIFIFNQWSS